MRYMATCKLGLEALVARELTSMGIEVESVLDARVLFRGDYRAMARACIGLRTAERVLMILGEFEARTFTELFDGVNAIDYRPYMSPRNFIHVNGKSAKSTLFSVSDCQSIAKKAIVESLRRSYRTSRITEDGAEIIVEIGILRDCVTVALDCCREGLSRRGYRTYNVAAPISETLGAALVTLARFKPGMTLYDPMCGSGTIPIEAAMIAQNIAPGLGRGFAFESWKFVPRDAVTMERERAMDAIRADDNLEICGSDIDPRCVELCKRHAQKAGVRVNWRVADIRDFSPRSDCLGAIICNPPYGERLMNRDEAAKLYRQMGKLLLPMRQLSKNIITAYPNFEREFSRRADKRRKLSNGGITTTLYQYFANAQREERE